MSILEALLKIPRCWMISTDDTIDMDSVVNIEVDENDTIHFTLKDGSMYRIRFRESHLVEKYCGYGGYKRI